MSYVIGNVAARGGASVAASAKKLRYAQDYLRWARSTSAKRKLTPAEISRVRKSQAAVKEASVAKGVTKGAPVKTTGPSPASKAAAEQIAKERAAAAKQAVAEQPVDDQSPAAYEEATVQAEPSQLPKLAAGGVGLFLLWRLLGKK